MDYHGRTPQRIYEELLAQAQAKAQAAQHGIVTPAIWEEVARDRSKAREDTASAPSICSCPRLVVVNRGCMCGHIEETYRERVKRRGF
jgi:hypothetical protein